MDFLEPSCFPPVVESFGNLSDCEIVSRPEKLNRKRPNCDKIKLIMENVGPEDSDEVGSNSCSSLKFLRDNAKRWKRKERMEVEEDDGITGRR